MNLIDAYRGKSKKIFLKMGLQSYPIFKTGCFFNDIKGLNEDQLFSDCWEIEGEKMVEIIGGVRWRINIDNTVYPVAGSDDTYSLNKLFTKYVNKPPMKVTLEWWEE